MINEWSLIVMCIISILNLSVVINYVEYNEANALKFHFERIELYTDISVVSLISHN